MSDKIKREARPRARRAVGDGLAGQVYGFAAGLAARYGIVAATRYASDPGRWELIWAPGPGGQPDEDTVRAELGRDRGLAPHACSIILRAAAAAERGPEP